MNKTSTLDARQRSKQLFGNRYMLEACVAIARTEGRVSLTQLAAGNGLSPSLLSVPLQRLSGVGLLVPAPHPDDDYRTRWYRRVDSNLWNTAIEFGE